MTQIIRRIEEKDFEEVSKIHDFDNDVEELKWLYRDTEDENVYNGFVAVNANNEIIGSICYKFFNYYINGTKTLCVVPANWILKSGYKGIAGVLLFKKVSNLGEVSVAVEGTAVAQKLYTMFKYKNVASANCYYKVLKVKSFYTGLKRKNYLMKLAMFGYLLISYFKTSLKKNTYTDVHLIPYDYKNFVKPLVDNSVLQKEITNSFIDWLLDCPSVKTLCYVLKKGDQELGMCVMYIKEQNKIFIGRIIQLPYLGMDNKLWVSAISKCVEALRNYNCSVVSIVSLHHSMNIGIKNSGFEKIKRHSLSIYLKDKEDKFKLLNTHDWHFLFSEADISFRNF